MVNSVRSAVGFQVGRVYELQYLFNLCLEEVAENHFKYVNFFVFDENAKIQDKISFMHSGLHDYFLERIWNCSFGDLLILIISNALKLHIIVFHISDDDLYSIFELGSGYDMTIRLILSKNHYDAIV